MDVTEHVLVFLKHACLLTITADYIKVYVCSEGLRGVRLLLREPASEQAHEEKSNRENRARHPLM